MDVFALFPFRRRTRRPSPRATRPRNVHPRLEPFEDRLLLTCNVISGYVYHDLNDNGLPDGGQPVIANSSIELRRADGIVVGRTTTDATGYYQFNADATLSTRETTVTPNPSVTFDNAPINSSRTKTLPQFNPDLGQLVSVDVILNGTITSTIRVENTD